MQLDLSIIGQGAVTPAGLGVESLLHGTPVATFVPSLGNPKYSYPTFRIDLTLPAFSRWQQEPRLRRASPLSFFLIEAGEQALRQLEPSERKRTGLIVAFCAGCLNYSRRFFEAIVKQGKKVASPALFPETVFNSPVSHIASTLGLEGAAYALVGDEVAWVAALKTAAVWLQRDRLDQVLILGAEEFDPIILDAYRCARWMRPNKGVTGFVPGEGAAGVLVTRKVVKEVPVISSARDGFLYRSAREAAQSARRCLETCHPHAPLYISAEHNWFKSIEESLMERRSIIKGEKSPYLGEAFTASAAWNLLRASSLLNERQTEILYPVWGLNHQVGALTLKLSEK